MRSAISRGTDSSSSRWGRTALVDFVEPSDDAAANASSRLQVWSVRFRGGTQVGAAWFIQVLAILAMHVLMVSMTVTIVMVVSMVVMVVALVVVAVYRFGLFFKFLVRSTAARFLLLLSAGNRALVCSSCLDAVL